MEKFIVMMHTNLYKSLEFLFLICANMEKKQTKVWGQTWVWQAIGIVEK